MSKLKVQMKSKIQMTKQKKKSSCPELVEGLIFSHLTFICHLDFVIWAYLIFGL